MSQQRSETKGPSVDELEAGYELKAAELESMRADGVLGVLSHAFHTVAGGGAMTFVFVSMLVGLRSFLGIEYTISPMTAAGVCLAIFIGSLFMAWKLVFVPRKGTDEVRLLVVGTEHFTLERQLAEARARGREG